MAIIITGRVVDAQINPQGDQGVINLEIAASQGAALLVVPAAASDIAALTIPGTFTLTVSQP